MTASPDANMGRRRAIIADGVRRDSLEDVRRLSERKARESSWSQGSVGARRHKTSKKNRADNAAQRLVVARISRVRAIRMIADVNQLGTWQELAEVVAFLE